MILTILVFLLTLLVLVVSHELGHFLMAKKFGVKVLEFGFGLPPRVWGKKIGETLVSLNWLPLGGFVKLLGEDEANADIRDNERSFASKPVGQRITMVSAGVVVNLILAWILFYTVLFFQDFKIQYPLTSPAAMITLIEPGFPAQAAGIKEGEIIEKINDQEISDIETAVSVIKSHPNQELKITLTDLDHKYERMVNVTPQDQSGQGKIGAGFSAIPYRSYNTFTEKS